MLPSNCNVKHKISSLVMNLHGDVQIMYTGAHQLIKTQHAKQFFTVISAIYNRTYKNLISYNLIPSIFIYTYSMYNYISQLPHTNVYKSTPIVYYFQSTWTLHRAYINNLASYRFIHMNLFARPVNWKRCS